MVVATTAEPWITAVVMRHQVVVERSTLATPDTAIAMGALRVSRLAQTLCDIAPLQRKVLVHVERASLIRAPARRTMVYDDILLKSSAHCILAITSLCLVTGSYAQEPYNNIVGSCCQVEATQTDTIAWSRLSHDGHVTTTNLQL